MLTNFFRTICIVPAVILSIVYISCKGDNAARSSLISQDSLPLQQFTIDNSRDTVLHTENGALLTIQKGSFSEDQVHLEIREAYSLEQMITGGLTTMSDSNLLSSGGKKWQNTLAPGQTLYCFYCNRNKWQDLFRLQKIQIC